MKLSVGGDHAGFGLKARLLKELKDWGHTTTDRGTYTVDSVDYPPYAHQVANDLQSGNADFGILICGSANGVCMTANKHQDVRAALCWMPEIAELARLHNNANIICLPARYLTEEIALECVKIFLSTPFEGGRHEKRVNQINC